MNYKLYQYKNLKEFEKDLALFEFETIFKSNYLIHNSENGILTVTSENIIESKDLQENLFSFYKIEVNNEIKFPKQAYLEQSAVNVRSNLKQDIFSNIMPTERRNKQYLWHNMHYYKGRFFPQLIKPFISRYTKENDMVIDPFGGCGTTVFECYVFKRYGISYDVNPLANFIVKTKIDSLKINYSDFSKDLKTFHNFIKKNLENNKNNLTYFIEEQGNPIEKPKNKLKIPDIPNVYHWFSKKNLYDLLILKKFIVENFIGPIKNLFLLSLGSIVKKCSYWDPQSIRPLRIKEDEKDVPTVKKSIEMALNKLDGNLYYSHKIIEKFDLLSEKLIPKHIDKSSVKMSEINNNEASLVITSPPYATALPYLQTDRLTTLFLDLIEKDNFKTIQNQLIGDRDISKNIINNYIAILEKKNEEIDLPSIIITAIKKIRNINNKSNVGFRRKNLPGLLLKYFLDIKSVFEEVYRVLNRNGILVFIIGDNSTKLGGKEVFTIKTTEFLIRICAQLGFETKRIIDMDPVAPYTKHINNAVLNEHIVIMKKT